MIHQIPTRADRELSAKQAGKDADAAFMHACTRLGLQIAVAGITPLAAIAVAEAERPA